MDGWMDGEERLKGGVLKRFSGHICGRFGVVVFGGKHYCVPRRSQSGKSIHVCKYCIYVKAAC